ncbi:MAG: hypothetical protein ABIR92_03350 [Gemmatimonadaceae bacterium]
MMKTLMVLFAVASPLLAQPDRAVALGDRVRIVAPETGYKQLVGQVTATTPDALSLKVDGSVGEFEVSRGDILSISRSVGHRRNTLRGIRVGLPVGAFAGIWFGPKQKIANGAPVGGSPVPRNALAGGVAGVLLGALFGTFIRSDDWVPILAQPKSAGLSVRF